MIKLSKEIFEKFKANPLHSKEGKGMQAEVIAKFYLPFTEACWLITEASLENGEWIMFGYCHIKEWEFGYVSLFDLMDIDIYGETVEIDHSIPEGCSIEDCLKNIRFVEV